MIPKVRNRQNLSENDQKCGNISKKYHQRWRLYHTAYIVSLFILFKLLFTAEAVACMPIYIVREGTLLEWAIELLSKKWEWTGWGGVEGIPFRLL